jgi:hypothetical protein
VLVATPKVLLLSFPSVFTDAKVRPHQGLCSGSSQTNQNIRFDYRDLGVQPGTARIDFGIARLPVNSTFASLLRNPFEMLYHIGDVNFGPIDARFLTAPYQVIFRPRPQNGRPTISS